MKTKKFKLNLNKLFSAVFYTLTFLLFFSFQIKGQSANEIGKINADVVINFRAEQLSAKLNYKYIAAEDNETVITFYLNEEFNVKKAECRLCLSFNFDRQAERLPSLLINLKEPLPKGKKLDIKIEYDGNLKGIYNKEHKFLELGLDHFWFPIHKSIDGFNFLYRLSIKTDEPNFQLVGNGLSTKKSKGWLIESRVPDFDIDLVFSDSFSFKTYRQDGYNLQIVSKNLPEEAPAALLANIKETLDFYNSTFGRADRQTDVTAVFRPFHIEGQGGYFRKGYFILAKTENIEDLIFPVSHELAHYWWRNANQQNAWLNESFAEYSAMLVLRRTKGVEAYNKMLEQKKNNSVNLPPIYGFDRTKNRQQTPGVIYRKGVIKLGELESELGEQKFMEFLRKAAAARVRETDKLIELLALVSSKEIADRFLNKLKE